VSLINNNHLGLVKKLVHQYYSRAQIEPLV
jgi:hypothetical protein